MARTFNTAAADLEKELCELIAAERLHARMDSYQKVSMAIAVACNVRLLCSPMLCLHSASRQVLHAYQPNHRTVTYKRAFEVGRKYAAESRNLLLRMSLLKNNVIIRDS